MQEYRGIIELLSGDVFALRITDEERDRTISARIHASCDAAALKNGLEVVARGEWSAVTGPSKPPSFSVQQLIVLDLPGENRSYRCFYKKDGNIAASENVECDSDEAVIRICTVTIADVLAFDAVEIWERDRKVGIVMRPEHEDAR